MNCKISVITVVYNDVEHIRETMESFFSQTWEDKEYIVVDGGSTDGTVEIIKDYSPRLAWWCSKKDGGIYDALNKGMRHCSGEWINVLNSGDQYTAADVLQQVAQYAQDAEADIIYGNGIEVSKTRERFVEAGKDINKLNRHAIFRHGCSFVRQSVQRKYPYDTAMKDKYGFALDFNSIFRMYHDGCVFQKVPLSIQKYDAIGVSSDPMQSLRYDYLITTQYGCTLRQQLQYVRDCIRLPLRQSRIYKWFVALVTEYILNGLVPHIPSWTLRRLFFKSIGIHIGKGSFVMRKNYIMSPLRLHIGSHSHINRDCVMDARGGIKIGDNVSISHRVNIITGSHDVQSASFKEKYYPITVEDYAWLGIGCTVLQGVTIGKGAVVCAGAVVKTDVAPYTVVGGVPAKVIKQRNKDLSYQCCGNQPWT